jgi:DNA-binding CsgD family transcriptional regulator
VSLTAARRSELLARYDARVATFDEIAARRGPIPPQVPALHVVRGHEPSARELEVLALVAKGRTTAEVARVLHISQETIKTHLANLRHKLQARNRAHAVALAYRRGLIV